MTLAEFRRKKREELKKLKTKPLQKISNNFIDNTIYRNNASAIKTIYYLASVLEKIEQLSEVKEVSEDALLSVEIDTRQMLKYTEMTLPDIRRNLKAMQETSISFINEQEQIEEGVNLLPRYKIKYGKHKIEIWIFKKIARMIIEVKRNYTFLNTKELMKFESKHSLRFLPLLYKIANYSKDAGKRKRMVLEELNEFFGVKYKKYKELERKILIPIKEELDVKSKITFEYEFEYENLGRGRPRIKEVVIDVITN
jgi:hypothetical protein